jgi:hypothetical protein
MRIVLAVPCLLLCASLASAQPAYIDHHTYPADFAAINPGDPVEDRPGYTWAHDGTGWLHQPATPRPATPCPKVIDSYLVLLTCAERPPKPVDPWTKGTFSFEVGTLYGWTYPTSDRLLVISVALDIGSLRRIVTGRRLKAGMPFGGPVVFYEDDSGGWAPLPPGETK